MKYAPGAGRWTAPLIVSLIPFVALVVVVARCAVDVPYMDEWELVPLLQKFDAGTLTFGDVWAQHNEHRLFFPYLIMLGLAQFTSWNIRAEVFLNLVLAAGVFSVMTLTVARTARHTCVYALVWSAPMLAIFSFSFRQWENWFWGAQIQVFLSVLCVLGAIYLLGSPKIGAARLAGAVVLGVVASYSFANGLLTWPIGLMMVVLPASPGASRWKRAAAWLAAGAATSAFYFTGYEASADRPSPVEVLGEGGDYLRYVLAYIGGAFSSRLPRATLLGGIGLVLGSFAYWAAARVEAARGLLAPYVGIGAYALLTAMMTSLGRTSIGIDQAVTSRYSTFSSLFWCCVVVMLLMASARTGTAARAPLVRTVATLALAVVVALSGVISILNTHVLPGLQKQLEWCSADVRRAVREREHTCPGAEILYPDPHVTMERARFLQRKRLSLFRDSDSGTD